MLTVNRMSQHNIGVLQPLPTLESKSLYPILLILVGVELRLMITAYLCVELSSRECLSCGDLRSLYDRINEDHNKFCHRRRSCSLESVKDDSYSKNNSSKV